jgi:hypothetical protein
VTNREQHYVNVIISIAQRTAQFSAIEMT